MLGGGSGDPDWLDRELAILAERTDRPWGVGFQSWAIELVTDLPSAAEWVARIDRVAVTEILRTNTER
ncbi:MAG TPA: hypothetical protein VG756_10505 [Pseudonocardiaceae bacterium]|nr:hypothetical protein [Pseudonocardiaceae bacterium]